MGRDQHHGHRGVYLTIGEAGVLKLHFICLLNFWDFFLVEISSKTLNVFHRRGSMSKCQAVKKGKNLAWMLLNLPKGCAYARVHKYAKVIRIPIGSKPSRRWEIYTPERRDIPAMTWLWDRWGSTSSCVFTSCTITPIVMFTIYTRFIHDIRWCSTPTSTSPECSTMLPSSSSVKLRTQPSRILVDMINIAKTYW